MPTKLKDSSGNFVKVQAGESCNLTGTLKDTDGTAVTPLTLTLTLFDFSSGAIVNDRNDQDVKDANGGTVTDGVYVIELDAADTAVVGSLAAGEQQDRVARVTYTWDDGDSTRTGIEEFTFPVESLRDAKGQGSGAISVTLTITDTGGVLIPNAHVYVTDDIAGLSIVAGPVLTSELGVTPPLSLDAGDYYRWASHDNYTFTNPQTVTVAS